MPGRGKNTRKMEMLPPEGVGNLKSVAGSSSSSLCAIFCHFAHRFCFCSQLLLYFRHRRRRLADVLARAVSHVGGLRERGS